MPCRCHRKSRTYQYATAGGVINAVVTTVTVNDWVVDVVARLDSTALLLIGYVHPTTLLKVLGCNKRRHLLEGSLSPSSSSAAGMPTLPSPAAASAPAPSPRAYAPADNLSPAPRATAVPSAAAASPSITTKGPVAASNATGSSLSPRFLYGDCTDGICHSMSSVYIPRMYCSLSSSDKAAVPRLGVHFVTQP